ncbi:MAG TPA: exo-alpha-sialidase [Chthoniobacterales bacterium]|nr:exo-alpha-sialidase [Chthoniobacterales bacterium]
MKRVFWFVNVLSLLLLCALMPSLARSQNAEGLSPQNLMSQLKWRCVGPYIGGRVVTVTGVPGNDNLFYAGAVGGGVWRSTDAGIEWENITDGKLAGPSSSIGAIAVAPSDPNTIYVGTGEADIRANMIPGDGVFKSADAGKTWQFSGLRDAHSIAAIVVDPKNPNVVYVASMGHVFAPDPNRGIFKSTDGGKTWQKILFVDNNTGAICLVMDPNHPAVMYATTWQAVRMPWGLISGGAGSGIYKTTDGGAHWTNISRNPGLPEGVLGRIGVSIAASKPDTVYAVIQAKEGGVFRSDDAGATWKRTNDEMKLRQRAFYYMTIYADPKDPNTVYAPEVDALFVSHDGAKTFTKLKTPHGDNHVLWINPNDTKILLEGNDGGATVSTDAGKTWSTEHNQPTAQFYHVNLDDQFPYHIYGAQQDEGSFEGPSASAGGVIPLSAWKEVAYGESTYTVPQPGDPKITYGSGYYSIFVRHDERTDEYRSVSPWPWYQEGASSGELKYRWGWTHPILFSPANPKQLFTAAEFVFKSDDDGAHWTQISPDLTRNDKSRQVPSGGPIDLDQSGAEIYPIISALSVSPLDPNLMWAGSDDGLVHLTTDGGKTWQKVTPPDLPDGRVNCIEPSHKNKQTAYLSARHYMQDDFKPYVYKTTDLGKHWTAMTNGLPQDEFVFDMREDPNDSNLLLIGTRSTVYCSLDAGAHWQPLTLNLPVAQVHDIAINTRQGQVVAATHGRSFWVLDNLVFLEQLAKKPAVQASAGYLFTPQQAWLTHDYGLPDPDSRRRPDAGYNPPFGATVFFHLPDNYDGKTPATLQFADAGGKVIRSIPLHLATAKEKEDKERATAGQYGIHLENVAAEPEHPEKSGVENIQEAEAKLAAAEPGMNRLQWDLRYPYATEVKGYHTPIAAGGLEDSVQGPVVTPGAYSVTLDYGGQKSQQTLTVALDPRIKSSQQDLEARLALALKIHADLDMLDKEINQAIDARDKLKQAVSSHSLTDPKAADIVAVLTRDIDAVVPLKARGSEGDLLYGTKLRDHLAYLAAEVDLSYGHPTAPQEEVFKQLDQQTNEARQKLQADLAQAEKLAPQTSGHS